MLLYRRYAGKPTAARVIVARTITKLEHSHLKIVCVIGERVYTGERGRMRD